jgi:hypothetical protein
MSFRREGAIQRPMRSKRLYPILLALAVLSAGVLAAHLPAFAAAPGDPVRARYAGDFKQALEGYARLGEIARADAETGLVPLDARWEQEMKSLDALLAPHERVFFPLMHRPWTREAAVFSNLEGARMWLWSVRDALKDGAAGVESIDVAGGRVRAELISNFTAYLAKARTLLAGGHFAGSYFDDTLTPILANYCAYPEDGQEVKPDFNDPRLFDDVRATPAAPEARL